MKNGCTHAITNADVRDFLRITLLRPCLVQRLRDREPQITHWLLRIWHAQEVVLLVSRVSDPDVCSILHLDAWVVSTAATSGCCGSAHSEDARDGPHHLAQI